MTRFKLLAAVLFAATFTTMQAQTNAVTVARADAPPNTGADAKSTAATPAEPAAAAQDKKADDEPAAIKYKGITFTPGGFLAGETVFRTRALNSDTATPFSSIPYMNSGDAHITEFNADGRQSRLALLVTAPVDWGKIGGYFEVDFLGAGTTSNNNQSNSYVLRQRELWAQLATTSGFTMQGGQMWSLLTEVKKGIVEAPTAENLPSVIDPNYVVGFSYTRQYGLRFAESLAGGKANVALSLEGSQIVLASTVNAPDNFVFGTAGSTSGQLNSTGNGSTAQNYSSNVAPDIIVKATFDPGYGHYEIGGLVRFFRDRVYPQTVFSTTVAGNLPGSNYTTPGGGFFVNARAPITKFADVGLHVLEGPGVGRYGASNLGDVTVRPNGLLEPLRSVQGLFSLETHPFKKLDIFSYAGAEYLQRTYYLSNTGVQVGYAAPSGQNNTGCSTQAPPTGTGGVTPANGANCTGATRYVAEASLGLTYRLFSSPSKGRLQYQMVYSYVTRVGWNGFTAGSSFATGTAFGGPQATENMVYTGMRYYIP